MVAYFEICQTYIEIQLPHLRNLGSKLWHFKHRPKKNLWFKWQQYTYIHILYIRENAQMLELLFLNWNLCATSFGGWCILWTVCSRKCAAFFVPFKWFSDEIILTSIDFFESSFCEPSSVPYFNICSEAYANPYRIFKWIDVYTLSVVYFCETKFCKQIFASLSFSYGLDAD